MGTTTSRLRVYQFHHLGNITTSNPLLLLFCWRRDVTFWGGFTLLLLEHRYIIIYCRLLLFDFQHRWIWQTGLSQLVCLLLGEVS